MGSRTSVALAALMAPAVWILLAASPAAAQSLLAPAENYPTGQQPGAVAVADFDDDGAADLAVTALDAEEDSEVSILAGEGGGTFGAATTYELSTAEFQWPAAIVASDLDGDGDEDLAVTATGNSDSLFILLNRGNGTFEEPVRYDPVLSQDWPLAVTADDFDGDGDEDLAVAFLLRNLAPGNISIFPNNGDGTFGAPAPLDTGTNEPTSLTSVDLNGDGAADLAATSEGAGNNGPSDLSVLFGRGDGTFESPVTYPVGSSPQFVVASDLNDDGSPDLATANFGDDTASVLLNRGDGTLGTATEFATGSEPYAIAAADFDGDGRTDLVTADSKGDAVSVLLGAGDGTFGPPEAYAAGTAPGFVGASDLNADGKPDVVTANADSNDVSVLLNVVPPSLSSVGPVSAFRGSTATLTLTGTALGKGAKVELSRGLLDLRASRVSFEGQTRLVAKVPIPKFAPTGSYALIVSNPDNREATLPGAFRVLATTNTRISSSADPEKLERGQSTRISGRLLGRAGKGLGKREVVLARRPAGGGRPFEEFETLTTRRDGTYSLAGIEPSRNTIYRARFAGDEEEGLEPSASRARVRVGR